MTTPTEIKQLQAAWETWIDQLTIDDIAWVDVESDGAEYGQDQLAELKSTRYIHPDQDDDSWTVDLESTEEGCYLYRPGVNRWYWVDYYDGKRTKEPITWVDVLAEMQVAITA